MENMKDVELGLDEIIAGIKEATGITITKEQAEGLAALIKRNKKYEREQKRKQDSQTNKIKIKNHHISV